jgi:hypothetical protein
MLSSAPEAEKRIILLSHSPATRPPHLQLRVRVEKINRDYFVSPSGLAASGEAGLS